MLSVQNTSGYDMMKLLIIRAVTFSPRCKAGDGGRAVGGGNWG